MDSPILLRQVRNGEQMLSFRAAVLGAATTERPGAARWTELTVYRLPRTPTEDPATGIYVMSKVGRSTVAHRAECAKVDARRMLPVREVSLEDLALRSSCLACQPEAFFDVAWMERTRYTVLQARTPADLAKVLLQGRPGEPPASRPTGVVAKAVEQIRLADPDFDHWAADHLSRSAEQ